MNNGDAPIEDSVQISVTGEQLSSRELTADFTRRFYTLGTDYRTVVLLLAAVFAVGVGAFVIRAVDVGFDDSSRADWGYFSAIFAFLLVVGGSAPMVAVAFRMIKNHWSRPFIRISELYAVVGLLSILFMLPLLAVLPPIEGRASIWISDEFIGVPVWWDLAAVAGLVVCGMGLLILSSIPDMAVAARHGDGPRSRFLGRISSFWRGTESQWNYHRIGIVLLAAFYFLLLVMVQTLVSVDFVMSLVPGWRDSILPPHQVLTGLQSAVAIVVVTAFIVRTFGGYKKYIPMESFWSISKIMLALSLLWAYFWFAGFITFWYGRVPVEQIVIKTVMFEAYRVPFLFNIILSFLVPVLLLIWNPVRKSVLGPTIAGVSILVGSFFMMIRLYVPAFGIKDVTAEAILTVPKTITPDLLDILLILGGLAGGVLIYMLASKIFPIISIWGMKEGLLYQRVRPLLRGRYLVVGRPE